MRLLLTALLLLCGDGAEARPDSPGVEARAEIPGVEGRDGSAGDEGRAGSPGPALPGSPGVQGPAGAPGSAGKGAPFPSPPSFPTPPHTGGGSGPVPDIPDLPIGLKSPALPGSPGGGSGPVPDIPDLPIGFKCEEGSVGSPGVQGYSRAPAPFRCDVNPRSSSTPESVHELRPSDITVIGAMGDSFTAGFGADAKTIAQEFVENRGISWSGGGQGTLEQHVTLPNILKKYNNKLWGYSTGDGDQDNVRAHLNVAISGAKSGGMPLQAKLLIKRMKNDPYVDFINDWKVVTIFAGSNDICDSCKIPKVYNASQFYKNMVEALDILHDQLPRTLVNLVEPANMPMVIELNKGFVCSTIHLIQCSCGAYPKTETAAKEMRKLTRQYQETVVEIAGSGRYDTRGDFTVVHQPVFRNSTVPLKGDGHIDMSYFSPDCFHLSAKGQEVAALSLWDNMFTPLGKKQSLRWSMYEEDIKCTSEDHPYIYTNFNSNPEEPAAPAANTDSSPPAKVTIVICIIGAVSVVVITVAIGLLIHVVKGVRRRHLYVQIPQNS